MSLVLTEEQEAIRKSARDFARTRMPVAHLRALRDARDATGFSREAWKEMAGLGFAGMSIPEEHGGVGLGLAELGVVLEELGRTLAPTPLVSTVVLGAGAIELAGSDAQKGEHLPRVAAGERVLALALDEGTRHAPHAIATRAERVSGGWRITGEKSFVPDGNAADALVVVAQTGDGPGLFLVRSDARGVARRRLATIDSRAAARVRLDGVEVKDADVLGDPSAATKTLELLLDRGAAALAAEMLGGAKEIFEVTVEYLKTRKQFGVPIGSFQALKHRAAAMFCEVELATSVVMQALRSLDANDAEARATVSAAKARANDTFVMVANEAVQMHGGIGVTDELDVGFYLKRARVCAAMLGDSALHRERFATLGGY
jgi:alkylation response protein AidB-like acyl-CoA dehydrogenase